MVLVRHLHEVVAKRLAVLDAKRPQHRRAEVLQVATHGRVGRQAGRDVDGFRQGLVLAVPEYVRVAIEEREREVRVIAVSWSVPVVVPP